jgi:tripartite-type tricarboxylate transporter receptor subunit TctC
MATTGRIGRVLGLVAIGLLAGASAASAHDAEKAFFAGKTVRIVVGSGVAGGYDVYARLIAPYLAKVLGTTVIVENQPGAGGLISLNRLYATPPDGLTMSFANGVSAAFAEITGQPGRHFELAKFDYLATVGAPPGLWLVAPNSPIKTVQQAIDAKKQWRWGASGPADGLGNGAAFTCAALKLDCKIVPGYRGSNEAGLAVTRGEMDAIYVPESSAYNFVQAGKNVALATMGRTKSRWFPDKPTIYEAVKLDDDGRWLFDFYTGVEGMGRILILPPGVPKARLAYLQEAVKETLHNPQLIAEGERAGRIMEYLDPESSHANALKVVAGITPEQRQRVQQIASRTK